MTQLQILMIFGLCLTSDTSPYDLTIDYKGISRFFWCKKSCYFTKHEITMKTIDKWPNCDRVCGVLAFNEHCDVPIEKLNLAFSKMNSFNGAIRIQNTQFQSLSFLPPMLISYDKFGIVISNNSMLTDIDPITKSTPIPGYSNFIQISNNSQLDLKGFCDSVNYKYIVELEVSGNKGDCVHQPNNSINTGGYGSHGVPGPPSLETTTRPWDLDNTPLFWDVDDQGFHDLSYFWLNTGNRIAAGVGFVINIFHLIVLFQKQLRKNFIYILMIGISICDIFYVATFIKKYPINLIYPDDVDSCNSFSYIRVLLDFLEVPVQEMTRKTSSFLAFLMALIRTLSVMFPTNGSLMSISRPIWALSLIIGVFLAFGCYDLKDYYNCSMKTQTFWCPKTETDEIEYGVDCPGRDDIFYRDRFTETIDGYFTITVAILYLFVTILLLYQLRLAQNRRKSLKSDKSESSTSMLVTVMTVSFFLSAVFYGLYFVTTQYLTDAWALVGSWKESSKVFLWTFLTFNSSVHCLICLFMSSQYRSVARRVFWFEKKETISVRGLESTSVAKTLDGSESGTTK